MVTVEFFGVARLRSQVPETTVDFPGESIDLKEVLDVLAGRFADLATDCIRDGNLAPEFIANLNGQRFVQGSSASLRHGDRLLIMSADAGG